MTYEYDAEGNRAGTTVGGTNREYIYDLANRVAAMMHSSGTRGWERAELYAGGWHMASEVSAGLEYIHADWLGTLRVRTNTSGGIVNSYTNLPFGDCFDQNGGSTCDGLIGADAAHFTDQDRDTETGLDHFMFRQYSSVQGRWMVPDPAGMAAVDPSNPQTWNRYAYVGNNPIGSVDPMGLCAAADDENAADPPKCVDRPPGPVGDVWEPGLLPCGVDPFCLQAGGIGPFGSPEAQIHCDTVDGQQHCMVGNANFAQYQIGGTYKIDWDAQRQAEEADKINAFLQQEAKVAAALKVSVADLRQLYETRTPYLAGGNWNFPIPSDATGEQCDHERCGSFPSLDFSHGGGFVHLDTANPYSDIPIGAIVHGFVDLLLGNTILSTGIPRP